MNAGKVKTFKHLGLYDSLYRNKLPGRKFLEKISNDWANLGTKTRSPYGNSFFGQSLFHVQLLKNVYGIRKRSFLKQLTFKSKEKRGNKSANLLNLLENKLDYFLFNSGYVKSLTRAKELIENGNVEVNKELVRNSGFILKPTDRVSLRGQNPLISGETMYNVVSGLSITTQWSLYQELIEDTILFNSVCGQQNLWRQPNKGNLLELHNPKLFNKNTVEHDFSKSLSILTSTVDTLRIKRNAVSNNRAYTTVSLENNLVSNKYLGKASNFLKSMRAVSENKDVQMKRYVASSCISSLTCGGLERYVTMGLLFNNLSTLKPIWEDCLDQVTADLSVDLNLALGILEQTDSNTASNYTLSFSENSLLLDTRDDTESDTSDETFTTPQLEEFELTGELENIREGADYYSQLEIDVVESRAPYMDAYSSISDIYRNHVEPVLSKKQEGDLEVEANLVEYPETLLISDYYADLVFLENEDRFTDCLLSAEYMSLGVILRDKKEGPQFNLVSRSPEVTGEGFYLDPELWELRSRLGEEFSESKIDSAEHVIKTIR